MVQSDVGHDACSVDWSLKSEVFTVATETYGLDVHSDGQNVPSQF